MKHIQKYFHYLCFMQLQKQYINDTGAHVARSVAYRTLEQEVGGLIPGLANILSTD